jgi:hypothetical protein
VSRSNSEDGLPRLEEFPLGSMESRAAARALLEAQERDVRRLQIVDCIPRPLPGQLKAARWRLAKVGRWWLDASYLCSAEHR